MTTALSIEQKEQFERDGFLVISDFFTSQEVGEMKARAQELLDSFDPTSHPKTRFSTDENQHAADTYFLDSASGVSYFFEERSLDADGELTVDKPGLAINKIGHLLHKLDPVFARFTNSERMQALIKSLPQTYQKAVILQSMLIFKQPYIGGAVNPHQDNSFLWTKPHSTTGFWFPLEDAGLDNGCLWFIPGSHKSMPVQRQFCRNPKYFTNAETLEGYPLAGSTAEKPLTFTYTEDYQPLPSADELYTPVKVPAGAAVLIHGSVVHKSHANISAKSRYTYAFHILDASLEYPRANWIRSPELLHQ